MKSPGRRAGGTTNAIYEDARRSEIEVATVWLAEVQKNAKTIDRRQGLGYGKK
jgi:hypothetical protein